ncbi:hypothetical protein O181_052774 [Austropuccinia psidii MF-1]|uniref:Uncharacterized protein n=1 Tax=Austropuccinia psidii MF-1 TaxID=1389203 RepID=A0A9Q3E1D8_9BASI|nr:hypothetical protein [Austropuccinia psidii MF-1]
MPQKAWCGCWKTFEEVFHVNIFPRDLIGAQNEQRQVILHPIENSKVGRRTQAERSTKGQARYLGSRQSCDPIISIFVVIVGWWIRLNLRLSGEFTKQAACPNDPRKDRRLSIYRSATGCGSSSF